MALRSTLVNRYLSRGFVEWYKNDMGYRPYGLLLHDILADSPSLREAVKRLPAQLKDDRDWRIKRAFDLQMKKITLPKEQWTTEQQDLPYMQPYLDEVHQEEHDRIKINPVD